MFSAHCPCPHPKQLSEHIACLISQVNVPGDEKHINQKRLRSDAEPKWGTRGRNLRNYEKSCTTYIQASKTGKATIVSFHFAFNFNSKSWAIIFKFLPLDQPSCSKSSAWHTNNPNNYGWLLDFRSFLREVMFGWQGHAWGRYAKWFDCRQERTIPSKARQSIKLADDNAGWSIRLDTNTKA